MPRTRRDPRIADSSSARAAPRSRDPAGARSHATPPPPPRLAGGAPGRPRSGPRPSSSNRRGPIARASAAARWRSPSAVGQSPGGGVRTRRADGRAARADRVLRGRGAPLSLAPASPRRRRCRARRQLLQPRRADPDGGLPHDLAHLVVENELALREGVWGVLVAGGMLRPRQGRGRPPQAPRDAARQGGDRPRRRQHHAGGGPDARDLRPLRGGRARRSGRRPARRRRALVDDSSRRRARAGL